MIGLVDLNNLYAPLNIFDIHIAMDAFSNKDSFKKYLAGELSINQEFFKILLGEKNVEIEGNAIIKHCCLSSFRTYYQPAPSYPNQRAAAPNN